MADKRLSELTDADFEAARKRIEDVLIEFRNERISVMRNNGLVVREADGTDSSIIRLGIDDALRIAVKRLIDDGQTDG